jgi:DNA polymerase-4
MRDNPDLAGKPIAVGGSPSRRGVIATCNYIAREFGIHSAMASATARKKCPDLIIVRPDMEKYRLASQQIHQIFKKYTSIVEPLSLDEAYLDVTDCHLLDGSATKIAEAIRDEVRSTIKITISAGIAPNKFLAKVASDWNKPDGQFLILPEDIEEFVSALPVKKLPGVGKVTSSRLKNIGIETCADVRQFDEEKLKTKFGSFAERLIRLSKGVDNRAVETERIRKSVSVENTYAADLPDLRSCINELPDLYVQLSKRLDRLDKDYQIHKQFIKIKFHDFIHTTVEMISDSTDMQNYTSLCEQGFERGDKPVRLLGMGVRVIPQSEKDEGTETENEEQLSFSLDH